MSKKSAHPGDHCQSEVLALPKLAKPLQINYLARDSGQVRLPEFTRTYQLKWKQNGNIDSNYSASVVTRECVANGARGMTKGVTVGRTETHRILSPLWVNPKLL